MLICCAVAGWLHGSAFFGSYEGDLPMINENKSADTRSPQVFLAVTTVLSCAALAWFVWHSFNDYHDAKATIERDFRVVELHGTIKHLDEVLTMSARMAAATADLSWESRYLAFEPRLDAAIKDEERFGVVRRQDAGSYVDKFFPDDKGKRGKEAIGFAKEHLIRLSNAQDASPAVLFDTRTGNAIDDEGMPYKLDSTNLNLRARAEYFTPAETSVLLQLDENGNFKIEHPVEANVGGTFMLPAGTLRAEIGRDFERTVGRNEDVNIGADKIQKIAHDDTKEVGNSHRITVTGDEIRLMKANSTETVEGNKSIKVTGALSVSSGSASKMNFTKTTGSFECDVFTVLAKSIVLEAPLVTVAGNLDVTGTLRAGAVLSNSGIVAPNLERKDFSGTKGTAGGLSDAKAIRS